MQTFVDMARRRTFILVWAGDKPRTVGWGGQDVKVPPRDQIAVTAPRRRGEPGDPASIYRYPSAVNMNDRPIPGTVVISDSETITPDGGSSKSFDAEAFVKSILARKELAEGGLRVVDDVENIPAAMADGLVSFNNAQVRAADATVRRERLRRADAAQRGERPAPLSEAEDAELRRAMRVLEERPKTVQVADADLDRVLTGAPALPALKAEPSEDLGDMATEILAAARRAKVKLTHEEQDALITRDPDGMQKVLERITKADTETAA